MEDQIENPFGKAWADNVSLLSTKNPVPNNIYSHLSPTAKLGINRMRLHNGLVKGLGAVAYGEKLGQAQSKKDAIDAILGIMYGGLPMAGISSAISSPVTQKFQDAADVKENGYKDLWI